MTWNSTGFDWDLKDTLWQNHTEIGPKFTTKCRIWLTVNHYRKEEVISSRKVPLKDLQRVIHMIGVVGSTTKPENIKTGIVVFITAAIIAVHIHTQSWVVQRKTKKGMQVHHTKLPQKGNECFMTFKLQLQVRQSFKKLLFILKIMTWIQ